MGRWCQVRCSCPNRTPIDPTQHGFGPYHCGHDDGVLFQTSPNDIFILGGVLADLFPQEPQLFPVYRHIHQWRRSYGFSTGDYLKIMGDLLHTWQMEIVALREWIEWGRDWSPNGLAYFEQKLEPAPHQMTTFYQRLTKQLKSLDQQLPVTAIPPILATSDSFRYASQQSGNPVEFIY